MELPLERPGVPFPVSTHTQVSGLGSIPVEQSMFLSHMDISIPVSVSLSPSLSFPPSKSNEKMSAGEDKKN